MKRIKFVDLHPFQDATKIEARLKATLRRLRDMPKQPARVVWEDDDDSELMVKGEPITYDDTKKSQTPGCPACGSAGGLCWRFSSEKG